ncbi:MAG: UMP kinase [Patescibacteria group bacterium]
MAMFVLSVGGSTIVPGGKVNVPFLNDFKKLITARVKRGDRFAIIAGGGGTCREYQAGLKQMAKPTREDLDWLGIHVTRLNAHLLRLAFGTKLAHKDIVIDPTKVVKKSWKTPVIFGSGWIPGRSTDDDAVRLAKQLGATTVINMSNVDYLYDKDPRHHKDAKRIEDITWKDYRKIVGNEWISGMNLPFDPIASKLAQSLKLRVVLIGSDTKNLQAVLSGKKFKGTVIHP